MSFNGNLSIVVCMYVYHSIVVCMCVYLSIIVCMYSYLSKVVCMLTLAKLFDVYLSIAVGLFT